MMSLLISILVLNLCLLLSGVPENWYGLEKAMKSLFEFQVCNEDL